MKDLADYLLARSTPHELQIFATYLRAVAALAAPLPMSGMLNVTRTAEGWTLTALGTAVPVTVVELRELAQLLEAAGGARPVFRDTSALRTKEKTT